MYVYVCMRVSNIRTYGKVSLWMHRPASMSLGKDNDLCSYSEGGNKVYTYYCVEI